VCENAVAGVKRYNAVNTIYRNRTAGFDERCSLLVEREHHRRSHQQLQRRLKQAQLSTTASVADIDFSVSRGLTKSKFLGPTGVGWSHISFGRSRCSMGNSYELESDSTSDLLGRWHL